MKRIILAIAVLTTCIACSGTRDNRSEDFNFGWRFTLGDNPEYSAADLDDSGWREIHLPHDWAVEGEFSEDNPSGCTGGALPGGTGWYRKSFRTPKMSEGGHVFVEFDGIYMNSTVYVNGKEAGTRPYGYISFCYDITGFLNGPGKDNVIAVRCDNSQQPNSRWYSGCGIYRDVRLVRTASAHVAYNGTYVTTPEVSTEKATVSVQTTIANHDSEKASIVRTSVMDASGQTLSSTSEEMPLAKGENILVSELSVKDPHLWDIKDPYMYTVITEIEIGGKTVDTYSTPFGIRTFNFDREKGFFLNGNPVKLLGVCQHHDLGCLGSAVHYRALERQLQILKDMGCNAIRTSHNPPAPQLLDMCDRMGFLVMDECFDAWRRHKKQYDYAGFFDEWHERDLKDFIARDRNHPSIIMWSIGNEIPEQWNRKEEIVDEMLINFMSKMKQEDLGDNSPGVILSRHIAEIFRENDPTRPLTSACNDSNPSNNILRSGALDIYGINYQTDNYDYINGWWPKDRFIVGSETASAITSRGVYFQPSTDTLIVSRQENSHHQLTSYDTCFVPWGASHEHAWYVVKTRDFVSGTFVWTGFDYLGEPTPYLYPSRSSYFGIVDLAGFPKDVYWMYQSEWTDKTVLHLLPHWNWKEGDKVDVWAYYGNADEVELFLNGKSLGRSSKEGDRLHAQWLEVPFEKGQIEAVSYKDGKEVARDVRKTTGKAESLTLTADRNEISADGYDLSFITVEALDADGMKVPDADTMLHFEVSGNGELAGIDNGSACDTLCLKGNDKAMFSGKALAVVRSIKGKTGKATLTVSSELGSASIDIKIRK